MDLLELGLSPAEFMAAHFLHRVSGRASGREIAEALGVGERTGRRVLESLAEKGLIQRVSNGRYMLLWLAESRPEMAESRSLVTESKVHLLVTSSNSPLVEVPSGTSTWASPPSEGLDQVRFPMADDLEPGRIGPPKPTEKKRRSLFNKPDKHHRLTQPRETWDVPHVVKEFEMHAQHAFPDSVYVAEGKKLSVTLRMARADYGITIEQMLTAVEQFFAHHASNVPKNTSPVQHFLAYLSKYIDQQPGGRQIDLNTDDWDRYNRGWE